MKQDFITTTKRMRKQRHFTERVNDTDVVNFSRCNSYHSVTVFYDIDDPDKKKVESLDSRHWEDIFAWLRERFNRNWARKQRNPAQIKIL